jgi:hypothetical protein
MPKTATKTRYRRDVSILQLSSLLPFDEGKGAAVAISGEHKFKPGDILEWEAGETHHGFAVVVSAEKPKDGLTDVILKEKKN